MLYIPVEVNGVPVKAFVDSGAQATIMSPGCAERCRITRLIDKRYAGVAKGVGTAAIVGRVHIAPILIGTNMFDCSFTVIEGKDVDMLLGLDMLKRYQACIDLHKNVLRIGNDEVEFLPESEIPKDGIGAPGPAVEGPGGIKVDGKTGALIPPDNEKGKAAEITPGSAQQQAGQASPSAPAAPGSSTAAGPSSAASPVSDKIQQLVNMGFSEQQARQALDAAQGNVDVAASILFDG